MTRFWNRVDKKSDNECWQWLGAVVGDYGVVTYKGKLKKAHRVAYELHNGIEPVNVVDHLCRNRLCVNPKHLEDVTKKENVLRGESFSARFARRTECNYGHPFDDNNTVINKSGYRSCKTCRRMQSEKQRRSLGIPKRTEITISRKQTHCKKGHEFTPENTRIYKGSQHCKECSRDRCREFMRKKRSS